MVYSCYFKDVYKRQRDILAALLDAADRGVQVRILVDGISTSLRMEGKEVFYALSAHPNVELKRCV